MSANSGGTLGGTGAISGNITVNSGGAIDPGASVGTLTVSGITLNAGSVLNYEFNNTQGNDRLVVSNSGGLTLNSANTLAATTLQGGTIVAGNAGALGTGTLTLSGNATLSAGIDGLTIANMS